jgi:hypothetical protein
MQRAFGVCYFYKILLSLSWGAQKLTGENLKVVWAEFST